MLSFIEYLAEAQQDAFGKEFYAHHAKRLHADADKYEQMGWHEMAKQKRQDALKHEALSKQTS